MIKRVLSGISVSFQHKDMISSVIPYDPHYRPHYLPRMRSIAQRRLKIPPWTLFLGSHLFIGSRTFQYYYISVLYPYHRHIDIDQALLLMFFTLRTYYRFSVLTVKNIQTQSSKCALFNLLQALFINDTNRHKSFYLFFAFNK